MSKLYIVAETNYQYNDETYYEPEGDGIIPITAYKKKDKALAECIKKNLEAFTSTNVSEYGYGLDEIVEDEEVVKQLADKYGIKWSDDYFYETGEEFQKKFRDMTEADQKLYMGNINVKFYKIVEIEVAS